MRSVRFSALACLASLSGACSDPAARETVQTTGSAIIEGLPSTAEEDFVVHIRVAGVGICTGTLIAPNAVLTALHCVSEIDPIKNYYCNDDGTVTSVSPGGGLFEGTVEPARIEIRVGPAPGLDDPVAYGERVFGSGSSTICKDDIAVVVLDRNLELPPQRIRLGEPTIRDGEARYAATDSTAPRVAQAIDQRRRRRPAALRCALPDDSRFRADVVRSPTGRARADEAPDPLTGTLRRAIRSASARPGAPHRTRPTH